MQWGWMRYRIPRRPFARRPFTICMHTWLDSGLVHGLRCKHVVVLIRQSLNLLLFNSKWDSCCSLSISLVSLAPLCHVYDMLKYISTHGLIHQYPLKKTDLRDISWNSHWYHSKLPFRLYKQVLLMFSYLVTKNIVFAGWLVTSGFKSVQEESLLSAKDHIWSRHNCVVFMYVSVSC